MSLDFKNLSCVNCSVLNTGDCIFGFLSTECFCQFQLKDVSQFAAHQENSRLMGFVLEERDWSHGGDGEPSFSVFVFESNTEGEKVRLPTVNPDAAISPLLSE